MGNLFDKVTGLLDLGGLGGSLAEDMGGSFWDPLDLTGAQAGARARKEAEKQLQAIRRNIEQPYSSSNPMGYRSASVNAGDFGLLGFNRDASGGYTVDTGRLFSGMPDLDSFVNDYYRNLTALQAPGEQRATNAFQNQLHNTGGFGLSVGGKNPMASSFYESQMLRDVANATAASQLGLQAQQVDQGFRLGAAGLLFPELNAVRSEADAAQQAQTGVGTQLANLATQGAAAGPHPELQGLGQLAATFFAGWFGGPGGASGVNSFFQGKNAQNANQINSIFGQGGVASGPTSGGSGFAGDLAGQIGGLFGSRGGGVQTSGIPTRNVDPWTGGSTDIGGSIMNDIFKRGGSFGTTGGRSTGSLFQ